jgi:transposase IS66-like protein/transposase IS166 family protein
MNRNPSEPPFDELLKHLESELPEPLFATVSKKFQELQYAELKIQALEERLRLKRIQMYGPGSEKLTNEQLELLELEPGVSTAEVQEESAREPVPERSAEKRVRQHPSRQTLPAELPRVERVIGCTAEQCVCGGCGREKTVIGYEESEQLEVEPAKYFVVVTKREKRACKSCERAGGAAAAADHREKFGERPCGDRHRGQQMSLGSTPTHFCQCGLRAECERYCASSMVSRRQG